MMDIRIIEKFGHKFLYIKQINNCILLTKEYKYNSNHISEKELLEYIRINDSSEYSKYKKILDNRKTIGTKREKQYTLYTLAIHPSRKCNLNCEYCYAEKNEYLPQNEISIETAKKAIDFMINEWGKNGKRYVVDLAGSGEPLLAIDFIKEIDKYCEEKRRMTGKDIKIMFPTNGILLDAELCEYFKNSPNILLGVSLDGNREHNRNRKLKNGAEAFDKTIEGIKRIDGRNYGIASTITNINENVDEVYDYLYNEFDNADAISMNLVRDFDYSSPTSFYKINIDNVIEHYDILLNKIYQKVLKGNYEYIKKILLGTDTMGIYLLRVLRAGSLSIYRCGAGKCVAAVDDKGLLYSCSVANGDKQFIIGDIYTGINQEKVKKYSNYSVEENNVCKKCWASYICSGECLITSKLSTGNMNNTNNLVCDFKRKLIELCIAFCYKLKIENKEGYKKVIDIVKNRTFFESVIDSGIWVTQIYMNKNGYIVNYTDIELSLDSTERGTPPQEIEQYINKHDEYFQAVKINDVNEFEKIKFPIISCLNKGKRMFYEYVYIDKKENENLIIRELGKEECYRIPIRLFLEYGSNIFLLHNNTN